MPGNDNAEPRPDALAINADLGYQRRVWIMQRIGWAIGTAVLGAASLGLFGFGPLSWSTAGTPGTFSIEYDRFSRVTAPTELIVRFDRAVLSENRLHLFLGDDYLKALRLDSSLPRIAESSAASRGVVLTFDTMPDADALKVVLAVSFTRSGLVRAEVGPMHGPRLRFLHWVYP